MRGRLASKLTYANVMSTLCFFFLLGGGAYALSVAPTDSVVSRSIKDGQVKQADISNTLTVSGAYHAARADKATNADHATNADSVDGETAAEIAGARAYAVVYGGHLCGAPVSFCSLFRSKGVAYAVHVGTGDYCVGVTGIDATDTKSLALVTPDVNSDSVWTTWRPVINGGNVNCVGSEFEVQTGIGQNGVNADFTIVVP